MNDKTCDFCEVKCTNLECELTVTKTYYDPPSGWKYGFPKEMPEGLDSEQLKQWLLDEGYPEKDLDFALQYGRTFTHD